MSAPLWTPEEVLAATGARAVGSLPVVTGVSIDTRTLQPGDLFFAIKGDVHDGHGFVRDALAKGAAAAVVAETRAAEFEGSGPLLVVHDVLDALRPFAKGRLVCVFGCGGDRDKGKRPIMGRIATSKADVVIVTDDNPRSEPPAAIRAEILAGAPSAREIGDRAEAIHATVAELRPGDVLVVAGKGHETGQIIGDRTLPFSDHEVLRAAIAKVVQR